MPQGKASYLKYVALVEGYDCDSFIADEKTKRAVYAFSTTVLTNFPASYSNIAVP